MQRCDNIERHAGPGRSVEPGRSIELGRSVEPSRSVILPVACPRDHDGVGRALRDVYLPHVAALPDDMLALLDKLA